MSWKQSNIKGLKKEFGLLEDKLKPLGFDRWTWDYHKVMYDHLFVIDGQNYYLRIPGRVVNDKHLENRKAVLRLMDPIVVRHLFPHGIEAVDDEAPAALQEQVSQKLKEVEEALTSA